MFGIDDALLAGVGNLWGAFDANRRNQEAAQQAQNFSAEQFANRYQTTVKDMEAAGLNPMLAYGQGGGSPPTGVSYQAQNAGLAGTQAYVAASNLDAQREALHAGAERDRSSAYQAQAQVELINSNVKEIVQRLESNLPQATKLLQSAQTDQAKAQTALTGGQTSLIDAQRAVLKETVKQLKSQSELNLAKGLSEVQSQRVMEQTVDKLKSETSLLDFDLKAIAYSDNFSKEFGQYKPFIDLLIRAMHH